MNIPTAHSTESLERFMQHVREAPTPDKVTRQYLKDNGFVSGNDPELRHIFRLLKFLDDNDTPTLKWDEYKNEGTSILRSAVESCYEGLIKVYPDATFNRTDQELAVWFRPPVTGSSRTSVERAIRTFRKLCILAGITPDNRIKSRDSLPVSPSLNSTDKLQLVLQVPPMKNKEDYKQLLGAIKEVFYD